MIVVLALVIGIGIGVVLTILFKDSWAEEFDPRREATRSRAEINEIQRETLRQMKAASRRADVGQLERRRSSRP